MQCIGQRTYYVSKCWSLILWSPSHADFVSAERFTSYHKNPLRKADNLQPLAQLRHDFTPPYHINIGNATISQSFSAFNKGIMGNHSLSRSDIYR